MGRGVIKKAATESLNVINFDFPYQGQQHAILSLRKNPDKTQDVMLYFERAHFLCHIDECSILARFDSAMPIRFTASVPQSRNINMIFINNADTFIQQLKKSSKISIEATFYQDGSHILEFDLADLKWE